MPPTSRKASSERPQSSRHQALIDSVHQALYGHLFAAGLVAITETTTTLTFTKEQATLLYRLLETVQSHPQVRRTVSSHLDYLIQLLRAANADKTPAVFESTPFVTPQVFHDTPLPPDLGTSEDPLDAALDALL